MNIKKYEKLQSSIVAQDENAFFTILYDSMAKPILAIAVSFKLNRRTPLNEKDVLQKVFTKVLEKGFTYFAGFSQQHFERYLLKMAYNQCKNALRNDKEIMSLNSYTGDPSLEGERSLSYDMNLDGQDLQTLLGFLPPIQRKIVELRLEGFLFEEIAQELQMGLSNVKYHFGKAEDRLKGAESIKKLKVTKAL